MRFALLVWTALLGACGTPATRPMSFVADAPRESTIGGSGNCVVNLRPIEDKRDSASSFGENPNFEKFAVNLSDWVKSAVASLDRPNRKLVPPDAQGKEALPGALTMTVRIHKAYIHGLAGTRTAQVVLSLQYEFDGKVIANQYYRGSDTSINWANSAEEVEAGMNAAMNLALVPMGKDLDRFCSQALSKT